MPLDNITLSSFVVNHAVPDQSEPEISGGELSQCERDHALLLFIPAVFQSHTSEPTLAAVFTGA